MGLVSPFLASCVFDIVATGDTKSFLEASAESSNNFKVESMELEQENQAFLGKSLASVDQLLTKSTGTVGDIRISSTRNCLFLFSFSSFSCSCQFLSSLSCTCADFLSPTF